MRLHFQSPKNPKKDIIDDMRDIDDAPEKLAETIRQWVKSLLKDLGEATQISMQLLPLKDCQDRPSAYITRGAQAVHL